jgi:hypothetical protein
MPLLDRNFPYVPSAHTDISATWRRFGFRPTTDSERRARQQRIPRELSLAGDDAPQKTELPQAQSALHATQFLHGR